jgi:hypothetical protein
MIGLVIQTGFVGSDTAAGSEGVKCPRRSSATAPEPGKPLSTPVELSVLEPPEPINLGGEDFEQVVVKASPPLGENVKPGQIVLYSPKSPRRSGSTLETEHLEMPTFSEPEIFEGERITFSVCVGDKSVDAGTYTGQVLVGGPKGVKGTAVTLTVNEKDESLFWIGVIIGLAGAVILSYLRAWKAAKDKLGDGGTWGTAWSNTWKDPWLLVITIGAVIVAYIGMQKIYANDPAWGAEKTGAVIALLGAMGSATGLSSFFSTFVSKSTG